MANFQASLIDPITSAYSLTASGGTMSIIDNSNYTTNTETGHALINFADFKKILIEAPDGTTYLESSLGDGDLTITLPGTNYTYDYSAIGDGVYKVTLYTVPTWNSGITYNTTTAPYVYYGGSLYRCIQTGTNKNPVTETAFWTVLTSIDSLSTKYRTFGYIAIHCEIDQCWADAVVQANCTEAKTECDDTSLCEDDSWRKAMRLDMIRMAIDELADQGLWTQAQNTINDGLTICCCN